MDLLPDSRIEDFPLEYVRTSPSFRCRYSQRDSSRTRHRYSIYTQILRFLPTLEQGLSKDTIDAQNLTEVSPSRGALGAKIIGPDNLPVDIQNADTLAPPTTDAGSM